MAIATYSAGGTLPPALPRSGSIQYILDAANKLSLLKIIAGEGVTSDIDLLPPPTVCPECPECPPSTGGVDLFDVPDYLIGLPLGLQVTVPDANKAEVLAILNKNIPTVTLLVAGNVTCAPKYGLISLIVLLGYSKAALMLIYDVPNENDTPSAYIFTLLLTADGSILVLKENYCDGTAPECPECPPASGIGLFDVPNYLTSLPNGVETVIPDANKAEVLTMMNHAIPTFDLISAGNIQLLPKYGIAMDVTSRFTNAKKAVMLLSWKIGATVDAVPQADLILILWGADDSMVAVRLNFPLDPVVPYIPFPPEWDDIHLGGTIGESKTVTIEHLNASLEFKNFLDKVPVLGTFGTATNNSKSTILLGTGVKYPVVNDVDEETWELCEMLVGNPFDGVYRGTVTRSLVTGHYTITKKFQ